MATSTQIKRRGRLGLVVGTVLAAIAFAAIAYADNVQDNVITSGVGQNDTITAGGSTTIGYRIQATGVGSDGQAGCNAADGSPVTIRLNLPAAVSATSADPTWNATDKSLTFSACAVFKDVAFSSSTPGTYAINVSSITDSGVGTYTNQANWTLHVLAPPDSTPPVVTPNVSGTLGNNGWYRSNVDVSWTVTDSESAISSSSGCGSTTISSDTAGTTLTCSATSAGGTSSQSVTIKKDATAPSVSCGSADGNWHKLDVSIPCSASDSGSGLVNLGDASFSLTTSVAADAETSNASTDSRIVADKAGNSSIGGPIDGNMVDKKAPQYACAAPPTTWSSADVTIACTATDGGSGLDPSTDATFQLTTSVAAGEETATAATGTKGLKDRVDNATTAGPITGLMVDKKDPTIALVSRAPGANGSGWNYTDVSLIWSCGDGGSGVVSSSVSDTVSAEGANQSSTGTCTDNVGHTASNTVSGISVDKSGPGIAFAGPSPAANANGWNNSDVTLSWTCTDALSGIAAGGSPVTALITTEGATQSGTGTCTDKAGNSASSTDGTVNIDKSDPNVSVASAKKDDASPYTAGTWSNQDVTVTFACVDSGPSGVDSLSPNPVVKSEGENQTAQTTCTDKAGNSVNGSFTDIDVDKTKPGISFVGPSPGKNGNGWNNGDVTLTWNCTDSLSGPVAVSVTDTVTSEGENQQGTGTCEDAAGNTKQLTSGDVDLDRTAPITAFAGQSPAANASGWNNTDVTLSWTCTDVLSGPLSGSVTQTITSEGANQGRTGTCTDKADNSSSDAQNGIDIDKTAPSIANNGATPGTPDGSNGWYIQAVNNAFDATDTLSGIDAACDAAFPKGVSTGSSEGSAVKVNSGTCTDLAGNTNSGIFSGAFKIDLTNPTTTFSTKSPAANGNVAANGLGWHKGAVTVSWACSDGVSGPAAPSVSENVSSEGYDQAVTGTCADNAGRTSTNTQHVNVDLTNPSLTWVGGPAGGASYYFGSVPAAPTCNASDTLSGPDGCAVTGYSSAVGAHTMTAKAKDKAGNEYTEQRSYTVLAWTLNGFFQPVDMASGVWNTVKNGSTVPLKFRVFAGSTELTDTAVVKTLAATQVSCTSGLEDAVEELAATGGTSLRYDTTAGQFIYNWQTPKKPGLCYRATVEMQDGSKLSANFKLK